MFWLNERQFARLAPLLPTDTRGKGRPEPDSELRDTENIPLPVGTVLPLPMAFGPDKPNDDLVAAMQPAIDTYIAAEVLPHVKDAWVDYGKTKIGYEIPINRHFYVYKPPRPLAAIEADIAKLEDEIAGLLKGLPCVQSPPMAAL